MRLPDAVANPVQAGAQGLLEHLGALVGITDCTRLQDALVTAAATLAQCALGQLYVLDATGTRLALVSSWLDGQLQAPHPSSLPRDYLDEPLLQFCLGQCQPLNIAQLNNGLYQAEFLPGGACAWHSVLCLPLSVPTGPQGVLLVAHRRSGALEASIAPLQHLGHFVMGQLTLLRQSQPAAVPGPTPPGVPAQGDSNYGLLGNSRSMRTVHGLIAKVLSYPMTVLITGETGTGKELVARAIHDNGARANKSFVVQNCASLPEHLLESELFGYRRGAFTGADTHHQGLFDAANGGTLFLDEIGDMQLALQGKLLRVLQEGEVRPLGSNKTHKVDVRIIAATHHNLEALVAAGRFRSDLYYRLSCFPIELPPLRERGADIRALVTRFSNGFCKAWKRPACGWAPQALQLLDAYPFPGNVRELKAIVERAVLLCEGGDVLPCHLPPRLRERSDGEAKSLRTRLEQHERGLLLDSLRRNGGNQSRCARELEVSRRTFINRMQRLGIKPAEHDFGQRRA